MMGRKTVIEVEGLVGGYGEDIILDNVNFDVYEGEIFVVLGGSGCGKSTLMKHLIGLIPPLSGSIRLDGEDIWKCDEEAFRGVLKKIGVLFQSGALFASMTVGENVALSVKEYTDLNQEEVNTLVRMKLSLVHLEGYEDYLPSQLSGGMKKRAALARALALNPRILFFDEPSAGLDPITSAELDNLILHLNRTFGTTMVIVTHELESIFEVAQRVIMLERNARGIIAEGSPKYLRDKSKNEYVKRFFNREAPQQFMAREVRV